MSPSDFIVCTVELARQVNLAKQAGNGNSKKEQLALKEHFTSNAGKFTFGCLAMVYIGRGDVAESDDLASVYARAESANLQEATQQMVENTSLPSQLTQGIVACVKRGLDINEEFKKMWKDKAG